VSLVLPTEGLTDQLDYILSAPIPGVLDWMLVLFVNDLIPDESTVYADLEIATFNGFTPVQMNRSAWTPAIIDGIHAVSTWGTSPKTWTCTSAPQPIYGYAAVTMVSPVIRIVERFADTVPLVTGGTVGVLPRYTLGTCPP
jgi:hypothetical protein